MNCPLFILAATIAIFPTERLGAEVVHLRDYSLHTPRDRGVLFTMAITPEQDVLSFVAKGDGKWLLTKVRNWLDNSPLEQSIDVPGWSRADLVGLFGGLTADLFVTPDGRFAICISSGVWKHDNQEKVSVVDLQEFKLVKTAHTSLNETRAHYFDRAGRFVTLALNVNGRTGESDERLELMDLPTLTVEDQCQFKEWIRGAEVTRREGENNCDALLSRISASRVSLAAYLDGLVRSDGLPRAHRNLSPPCSSREVTADGRFELQYCENFHHNWLDNPVVSDRRFNIRSVKTGSVVGTIEEPNRESIKSKLVYQSGRDILLIMEGGTKLKAYQLKE